MKEGLYLEDRIYGTHEITEPLLVDLINSPPMQRIKKINQFGIPDEFYHRKNFSRYEHCIGVMLLLRCLGASLEEQTAGLLHDVSHLAFSHLYDWVIGDSSKGPLPEEAQDKHHDAFIRDSDIPHILQRHGFSSTQIIDYHHFTLLETAAPNLCADRVDYSIREFPIQKAQEIFHGLTVADNMIVCKTKLVAARFARSYLSLQRYHWGNFEAMARYEYFSTVLKRALSLGVISNEDFLINDEHITAKIKSSIDPTIQRLLQILRRPLKQGSKEGKLVYKKFRFIDPFYLSGSGLKRLTDTDEKFRILLEEARRENQQGVFVPNII